MAEFALLPSVGGGALVGAAAALLLLANGRVAGVSGVLAGVLAPAPGETAWRAMFLAGLLGGAATLVLLSGEPLPYRPRAGEAATLAAGLLVGAGARLANGCTSGHAVCGVARLSGRSLAATGVFMTVAAATVFAARRLLGG